MRSYRHLRARTERPVPGLADRRGSAFRFPLQHLPKHRTSAGSDRQSGRGFAARRDCSGADGVSLFCGQHRGRALFRHHAGGTQSQCDKIPSASGGNAGRSTTSAGGSQQASGQTPKRRGSMSESLRTKKEMILQSAREIGAQRYTAAEIDQLRRRLLAEYGEEGKTASDYIADVLKEAGLKVVLTLQEEAEDQYEEEFEDLLHFKTLDDAEVSIMRLDELMRKFQAHQERAAVERVLNVARLGKRRAEMIARNPKVEPQKRAEKEEIASWFRIWLETPNVFFDWLDVRKQAPDFQAKFPQAESEAEA